MHLPPLPLAILLAVFALSLLVTMGAAALFTRSLEAISDMFDLSTGLLSLLGALGANIPNYTASIVAIVSAQFAIGLGIIIGSNIYNIAIILAISTFATPSRQGITLTLKEARDARLVAIYTLAIELDFDYAEYAHHHLNRFLQKVATSPFEQWLEDVRMYAYGYLPME